MSYSLTEATQNEYFTLRLGERGWRVVVSQLALNSHYPSPNLTLDGYAGPFTIGAVRDVQAALGIKQDSVAGPETQEHFTKVKCRHAEKRTTPPGLLAGLCNIESSYQWACVSPLNNNNTVDYGVAQESIGQPPGTGALMIAFNPERACRNLAVDTRDAYELFVAKVGNKRAWELAALFHNWEVAAEKLANGEEAWLDKPFAFTTAKGYASGLSYAQHYMAVATAQVNSWTVS